MANLKFPKAQDLEEVKILIVDDDDVAVMALKRAISKMKIVNPLRVASDGQEALDMLRGEITAEQLLPPYIILLDLAMPRMNGHQFLEHVRKDSALHRAVIFVLTTSDAPEDICAAYDQHVAGYVVKDDLSSTLGETLSLVEIYSRLVVLPSN